MKVLYTKNIYTIYLFYNIHTKNTLINNDELLFLILQCSPWQGVPLNQISESVAALPHRS